MTRKLSIKEFEATGHVAVEFIGIFDSFLDLMIDVGKSERLGDNSTPAIMPHIQRVFKRETPTGRRCVFDGNECTMRPRRSLN